MKKPVLLLCLFLSCFSLFAQEFQQEAVAINIEVQVRVFKGKSFIDNLAIEDFEVYEDGKLQSLEAMYLIKGVNIERESTKEETANVKKRYAPETTRHFILIFELTHLLPQVSQAVEYFFNNVVMAGDSVTIITPSSTYTLNSNVLGSIPIEEIAQKLKDKLNKDIFQAYGEYRAMLQYLSEPEKAPSPPRLKAMKEMRIAEEFSVRLDESIVRQRIIDYLYLEQKKILALAEHVKKLKGQKHVLLFYQAEILPVNHADVLAKAQNLDMKKIEQAYADSSSSFHLLYITKRNQSPREGLMNWENRSPSLIKRRRSSPSVGKIFNAFNKMSRATGGISDKSRNIEALVKKVTSAAESSYLLYYSPQDYAPDGKFRKIKVKIKGKRYKVYHRTGYIAD